MLIFLLQNGALWDMGYLHCGICEKSLMLSNTLTERIKTECYVRQQLN